MEAAPDAARQANHAHCVRAARQREPRLRHRAVRRARRPRARRRGRQGTGEQRGETVFTSQGC